MNKNKNLILDFDTIVRKYYKMVFRIAIGFVHKKEDAEDITQDVFINAYNNRNKFKGKSEVSTWLYRITVNVSLNYISGIKRREIFTENYEDSTGFLVEKDNPHKKMEQVENNRRIQCAIDSLPDRQKTAFVLSRYEELTQRQIAEVMKTSEGAVEQLLQRATLNLRKKLKFP